MTAAHCVVDWGDFLTYGAAVLGAHQLSRPASIVQTIKFKKIIVHPQYNANSMNNDIALVVLQSEVKFNNYVQPACLPTSSKDSPPVNSQVNVSM